MSTLKNITGNLDDVNPNNQDTSENLPWEEIGALTDHKKGAVTLSYTYNCTDLPWRIEYASIIRHCGNKVIYNQNPITGKWGVVSAMFCKRRLCPLCSWRRSIAMFREVFRIVTTQEFREIEFVFLTLTVKNCSGTELSETIDRLSSAWRILTKNEYDPFHKSFLGTLRSIEVTYDRDKFITINRYKAAKDYYDRLGISVNDRNSNYGTYHPHIHVLAAVHKDYFKKSNHDYISHERLQELWVNALNRAKKTTRKDSTTTYADGDTFGVRLNLGKKINTIKTAKRNNYIPIDYIPQVRIEKIWNQTSKAVAEIAKYTVKPADYIDLPEVVEVLDPALKRRRLIAYGGLFAEVRERLESDTLQEDTVDNDLVKNSLVKRLVLNWTFQGAYKITMVKHTSQTDAEMNAKEAEE